ncbi:amino acid adenylation domain-containing protein/non-ribosomal peptide synthase protein (TIGR01720 family) [Catenulispora sp. GAS73]|uniref:amino acid adenylation domain-containing protein n=1 Tax=Catenulispora sp. GAS73 TaxID=3156269 RepID=UPI0035167E80
MTFSGVSSAQEALWLEHNLAPGVPNSTTTIWALRGDVDRGLLEDAVRTAVAEATALQVNFERDGDELRLVPREPDAWELFSLDVSAAADPAATARAFLTEQVGRPFDLGTDALFRIGTVRLAEDHHLLCLILHQILIDAFGVLTLLSQRVAEIYRGLRTGSPAPDRPQPPPGTAGEREAAYHASGQFAEAEEFWRGYVTDGGTAARIPAGVRAAATARAADASFWDALTGPLGVATATARVAAIEAAGWQSAAEAAGTNVTDLITAAVAVFLQRLCDTPKPVFSFTVNHRSGRVRQALGLYSNTLPLAVEVPASATFVELAGAVRKARLRVLEHAEYNVALIKRLAGHAGEARSPFGPVLTVVPALRELDLAGAVGRFAGGTHGVPDEIRIVTYTDGGADSDLYIRFDAPANLYSDEDTAGLTEMFTAFVRAALADPRARVQDVSVLGADERDAILDRGTGPVAELYGATVPELLDRQAAAAPETVAVEHEDSVLTYGALAARAAVLARRLVACGAAPGRCVAVSVPSSIELVVAVVAVLRSGAAVLPIDPGSTSEHVEAMLADARPTLLLTVVGAGDLAITPFDGGQPRWEASVVEGSAGSAGAADTDDAPVGSCAGADAALVRYASAPHREAVGVVLTHTALANGLLGMRQRYRLDETDRVLSGSPESLADPVRTILGPLIAGATIVLPRQDLRWDAASLAATVRRTAATTLTVVPSVLADLVREDAAADCKGLRRVLCGGEALPAGVAARFHEVSGVPVHYLYGVDGAAPDVASSDYLPGAPTVPLGRPVGNTGVYVLDGRLHLVPAGVVGEVYVGGAGLARGYLRRPAATADRFVASPFGPAGSRLYRTGDLARWNRDGELEYAGRADQRVQIRGLRADPFEVETVLAAHGGVAQAAVIARPDRPEQPEQPDQPDQPGHLVAYVVPAAAGRLGAAGEDADFSAGLDVTELRRFAAARLPAHLVPATVIVLDSLPTAANGELDRAALPEPRTTRRAHRGPRTGEERILADAFAEVLGGGRISVDDDFFTLGGDSISAMRVVTIARAGGLTLSARTVFECRTVAALAAAATRADAEADGDGDGAVDAAAVARDADRAAGPIALPPMARLFAERGPGLDRLAQWLVLSVSADLDLELLTGAVQAVLDHHDVLRARLADGELQIRPAGSVTADRLVRRVPWPGDWSGPEWQAALADEGAAATGQISASAGEMVRLVWFEPSGGGSGRLLIALHHLVVDGMSWRVLVPDLAEAAKQLRAGRPPSPAPVGTPLRRWLDELAAEAARPSRVAELELWRGMLQEPAEPLGSRFVDPRVDLTKTARTLRFELPEALSRALLTTVAAEFRCGVDEVLLTAFVLALAARRRGPGTAGEVVRVEGHGRQEELVPGVDLTRTIGWFTTVYPVRVDLAGLDVADALDGGPAAAAALRRVKQSRRALPDQGLGYTLLRHVNETTAAVLRDHPIDEVGFNYLGRFSFERSRTDREAAWTPAPEFAELVPAQDPEMPLACGLELNSLVVGADDGERLLALFTFATGLLSEAEVQALAESWQTALRSLHAQALAGASGLTPSDTPLVDVRQEELDEWRHRFGRVRDVWPLTPLQQGLLYHGMLGDTASTSYQTQFVFRITGPVDPERLRLAAQTLLDRHPALRTAFVTTATGEPAQVVVDGVEAPFQHIDLAGSPEPEERLLRILAEERENRFRPDAVPLLRFGLVTLSPSQSELALTAHHVLFDGWSLPLIEQELMRLYAGADDDLDAVEHGFRDFLRWRSRQDTGRAVAAWAEELSGVTQPTLLAKGTAPVGAGTVVSEIGQCDVRLTRQEAAAVVREAAACGITPNVLVQGAWAVVLAQLTGSSDVVFGSSVAVRPPQVPDADIAVGMFTNTVPVRVRCEPGADLEQMFRAVQDAQARMLEHYHAGLSDIQQATGLTPLFDTIVVFESFPVDWAALSRAGASADLTVTGIRPFAPTHYPLTVLAAADPILGLTLQFHPEVLDPGAVEEIADRFARVLRQFAADPRARAASVDLLSDAERRLVIQEWNDTAAEVPDECAVVQFARQAAATPDAVALQVREQRLTYAELNERANRMAHWLISRGIGAERRVVVLLPRSADLVAALLAVWKAGGCYVPVDPDHPEARVRSVIADCGADLVLDEALLARTDLAGYPAADPVLDAAPDRAAYTIYTSGSTGTPKGVVVGQRALTNFLAAMRRALRMSASDRLAAVTTIAFDIAALELFLPLTTGSRVVLADRGQAADPRVLLDLVEDAGVTVLQATPALWQMLVSHDAGRLAGLRVLTGGEALPRPLADALCAHAAQVVNLYGPTETTVWSTSADLATSQPPSIGTPVANTRILILDAALRPVPPGVAGDLWIAGDGLARGYHRQPGLTAARFAADPFGPPGSRMYRTGDLARWSRTGEVEFLGRADFQIKLRGFRIEPGDVEHALIRHPAIREAVVIVREDRPGDKRLVAYVVAGAGDDAADDHADADPDAAAELPPTGQIRGFVRDLLPDYMVPSAVVALTAIPVTPHGKLDRARLPRPETAGATYRAPEAPRETALCELFAEILGVPRVGLDDDFFALGGHSLLATRLAARVRSDLGVEIPIRTLFAAPTVAELARRWDGLAASVRKPLHRMTER